MMRPTTIPESRQHPFPLHTIPAPSPSFPLRLPPSTRVSTRTIHSSLHPENIRTRRTSKDRNDRLVHSPDPLNLEVVRCDECSDEEDAEDTKSPSGCVSWRRNRSEWVDDRKRRERLKESCSAVRMAVVILASMEGVRGDD
jgi:hypothetical protein